MWQQPPSPRLVTLVPLSQFLSVVVATTFTLVPSPSLKLPVGSTSCPSACKAGVVRNVKVLLGTGFRGSGSRGFRSPKGNNPPSRLVLCLPHKMWPGWQCGCYCQLPGLSDLLLDCCCSNTAANLAGRTAGATSRHPLCSLLTLAPAVPPACSQQGVAFACNLQHKSWPIWRCACCRQGCHTCYSSVVTEFSYTFASTAELRDPKVVLL